LSYFSENATQIIDGLLFGLGLLAVYLGAVITGALIRSLGGAGSTGLALAWRYLAGWFDYLRGDDRHTINVTLNMIVDNHLKIDTLVADHRVWDVWPNPYRVQMIRRAARGTTAENPVLEFPVEATTSLWLRNSFSHRCREFTHDLLASVHVIENGRARRVRLMREDDYRAVYGPLISLVSEKTDNDNAIDLALGRPMEEYRFVIALTFEKLHNRRARHLRAMVMWEEALLDLPSQCPRVDFDEHKTRFLTLQAIARRYRAHPERFGIVKVWRPRELKGTGRRRAELDRAVLLGGREETAQ
jgi:hypothetical protein